MSNSLTLLVRAPACVHDVRYILCANLTYSLYAVERHAVAYLADFEMPTHPGYIGALVDNDKRIPVRLLQVYHAYAPHIYLGMLDHPTTLIEQPLLYQEKDGEKQAARALFASLFWTAKRVYISSVWKIGAIG